MKVTEKKSWERLEQNKMVRLRIVPDECVDLGNLFGDTFDPKVNSDILEEELKRQEQEEIERLNRDGVWGIIGEFKLTPCDCLDTELCKCKTWEQADSVWGFIGNDWKGSGYDTDIMAGTIKALKETLKTRCPACRQPIKTEH